MVGRLLVESADGGKLGQDLGGTGVESNPTWEIRLERSAHEED